MTAKRRPPRSAARDFETAVAAAEKARRGRVEFRLYVAGTSERSVRAIQHARELCDDEFAGRAQLEVIDIFQQPARARTDQILAVPTLVRHRPLPIKRFIGDLSDRARLIAGLGRTAGET